MLKGALLARLKPPFEPLGRYRIPVLAAIGALVLLYALSAHLERRDWALALAAIVVLALFVLLNRVFFLLMPVSVYENGLEIDLPRSWNKSAYLAWQDLTTYRFEGSVLHYAWRAGGVTVLRNGKWPARWLVLYFPRALKIPDETTLVLLQPRLAARMAPADAASPSG